MLVRFKTTICGIDELGDHCEAGVTHVLSILDPDAPEPPDFGSFGEHSRVELRFYDAIEQLVDHVVPELQHVERILALGRDLTSSAAADSHLLVHCHAGVSRSTAAMTIMLAQARPDCSGVEIVRGVGPAGVRGTTALLVVQVAQFVSKDLHVIGRTPWYVRSVFYTACFYAFVLGGAFDEGKQFIYFQF